jgi:hypothetical protein
MCFVPSSTSLRNDRISDTSEACSVGVKRRGSSGEIVGSVAGSIGPLLSSFVSNGGSGGGDDEGEALPNVWDRRDLELDGVL